MRRFRIFPASIGMMAFGAVALGPSVAAARGGTPKDPAKAAEIRSCLEGQGLTAKPTTTPTEAERAQIAAAKAACGIGVGTGARPAGRGGAGGPLAGGDAAAKAQKLQCLAERGISPGRPNAGLSAEARQARLDALAACGITAGRKAGAPAAG